MVGRKTTREDYTAELDLGEFPKAKTPNQIKKSKVKVEICPFTVLVDTREQLPYHFTELGLLIPTHPCKLDSGDYSIDTMDDAIAIERKSLQDLYGSCTWGRERFEAEIGRLDDLSGFAAVCVEASWAEIADPVAFDPSWSNKAKPITILGTIAAWSVRYRRVHWWAAGDRRQAEKQVFLGLKAYWNEVQKRIG